MKEGFDFLLEHRKLIVQPILSSENIESIAIRAILDTGAGKTVITENVALHLEIDLLKPIRYENLNTAGGGIKAKIVLNPEIKLFNRIFRNLEVAIVKLPPTTLVSALIGIDILYQLKEFTISFTDKKIYL
ncbi:MAG: retropepsin-like aspartic protease [Arcicella sp.]|nr:retropepsin-like aspartic protease [Arcicella sp.]